MIGYTENIKCPYCNSVQKVIKIKIDTDNLNEGYCDAEQCGKEYLLFFIKDDKNNFLFRTETYHYETKEIK